MNVLGFRDSRAGIFLTYLVPDTLLSFPLFQIVGGLGLLDSYWGMVLVYPHPHRAVLHLDHDRLFPVDPEGAR